MPEKARCLGCWQCPWLSALVTGHPATIVTNGARETDPVLHTWILSLITRPAHSKGFRDSGKHVTSPLGAS